MKILSNIPVKFNTPDLLSRLHIEPNSEDADEFGKLVETVSSIANPKAMFDVCYIEDRTDNTVSVGGATFTSRALRINTDKVEMVFPFVATCGAEFDRIDILRDEMLKQYWLDELKAAALCAAHNYLSSHLKERYALPGTASMSPGSGDSDVWHIEQQRILFSLLGDAEKAVGVRLTDTCLMIPNKSISGIAYPSEVTFETCRLCHRKQCCGRKAPFDKVLFERMT